MLRSGIVRRWRDDHLATTSRLIPYRPFRSRRSCLWRAARKVAKMAERFRASRKCLEVIAKAPVLWIILGRGVF
jgi:hypothetical protein